MGKQAVKKPKKQKVQKKVVAPVEPGTDLVERQVEAHNHRVLSIVCIAGIAGALLMLFLFFSSDMRGNIIAAKSKPVSAAPVSAVKDSKTDDDELDIAEVLDDSDVSKELLIAHMLRMDDKEFKAFVEKFTGKTESSQTETTAAVSEQTVSENNPHSLIIQEGTDKSDVIAQLQEMDDADFQSFIDSITVTPASETAGTNDRLKLTLEDAYAEAEWLYPGQVDGSKRLKLIAELNETDFMYYVAEEGDTLIKLSRAFNVPLGQLVELNGIHDADFIPAGMILLFPIGTEPVEPVATK